MHLDLTAEVSPRIDMDSVCELRWQVFYDRQLHLELPPLVQLENDGGSVHLGDTRQEVRRVRHHRRPRLWVGDPGSANKVSGPIVELHSHDGVLNVAFADLPVDQGLQRLCSVVHQDLRLLGPQEARTEKASALPLLRILSEASSQRHSNSRMARRKQPTSQFSASR